MSEWDGPELPYAGTSGWSGSDTSQARAHDADTTGATGRRQRDALAYLAGAGPHGATWRDIATNLGLHHGGASGVLSVLHKTHHVARLTQTRDRCKIYVLPDHVNGRETEAHGRRARDEQ